MLAGILYLWFESSLETRGVTRPAAEPPREPVPGRTEEQPLARVPAEPVPTPAGAGELEPFRATRTQDERLRGKVGSLRGHIEVTGEEPFPSAWCLVARPSLYFAGREHAVEQRLEFQDGRRDFELSSIPLGAYDVFGEAEGFNGPAVSVALEPGNEHPFVTLRLVPCGVLEGRVVDAQGLAAEGVVISLLVEGSTAAREAKSDALGMYRFEKLPDGAYDLLVGTATAPLMPERRPVRFQAPHLFFPDIELPPLGTLHVRVVDSLARPLEGVEVRGTGTMGGAVDGRTDANGELTTRHLPAGHFRLRLEHPSLGAAYSRRVAVDVKAGATAEAPVRLGP